MRTDSARYRSNPGERELVRDNRSPARCSEAYGHFPLIFKRLLNPSVRLSTTYLVVCPPEPQWDVLFARANPLPVNGLGQGSRNVAPALKGVKQYLCNDFAT